jgi:hypothetical protein
VWKASLDRGAWNEGKRHIRSGKVAVPEEGVEHCIVEQSVIRGRDEDGPRREVGPFEALKDASARGIRAPHDFDDSRFAECSEFPDVVEQRGFVDIDQDAVDGRSSDQSFDNSDEHRLAFDLE